MTKTKLITNGPICLRYITPPVPPREGTRPTNPWSSPLTRRPGFMTLCLALGIAFPALAADNATKQTESIDGFRDTPMLPGGKWHLHDPDRPQPRVVTPGATFSQNAPAPSDAEVLFDGKDLSKWQNAQGQDATWRVQDGCVETAARGGGIRTRGKWADFQLHVEWASPTPPRGTGQGRGNSGVLINGMYEVHVLDSYQAKTYT